MQIGFVGTGGMGRPMAERLLAAGHRLVVYNRSRAKAQPLAELGATLAPDPRAATEGSELVLTMLADDHAEWAVLEGERGILHAGPGVVHVACTTLGVATARELLDRHREAGQDYLSCPVFGRPDAAAAGRLWGVCAGPAAALDRARSALQAFTQGLFELGESPEQANLVKLAGNFTLMAMVETLGEAFALAEKAGVPRARFLEILTGTLYPTPVYRNYGAMIAEHRYHPPGFPARLGLKDARLALAAAEELRVPLPLAGLVRDGLVESLARGRGDADWAVLGSVAADHAGLAPTDAGPSLARTGSPAETGS